MNNRAKRIPMANLRKLSKELATVLDGMKYGIIRLSEKIPFRSEANGCMLIAVSVSWDDENLFINSKRHSEDVDLIEVPIEEVYLDMAHSSGNEEKLLAVLRRSVVDTFLTPVAEGIFERQGEGRLYLVDKEDYESYLKRYPYEAGKDPGIHGNIRLSEASVVYIDRKAEGDYVLGLHNSFNPQHERDILDVNLPDIKKFAEQLQSFCPGTIKRRAEKNDSGLDAIDIIGKVITNLLRKEIKEKNCSVLLTQEMADHIYKLYLSTEDIDRVDLPCPDGQEFSKELLDRHVGEYIWIEIFGDPVPDILSLNELPKEFKLTFADFQTEVSLDSLFELFDDASFGSIIMDVYFAIYLQKKNNMPDSEIVQILSKAILA